VAVDDASSVGRVDGAAAAPMMTARVEVGPVGDSVELQRFPADLNREGFTER
jgi:hypothetical protein